MSNPLTPKTKEFVERIGGETGEFASSVFKVHAPEAQDQLKPYFSTLILKTGSDRQRKSGNRKGQRVRDEIVTRIRNVLKCDGDERRYNAAIAGDVVDGIKSDLARADLTPERRALLEQCTKKSEEKIARMVGDVRGA
jgi:hypothetical protein